MIHGAGGGQRKRKKDKNDEAVAHWTKRIAGLTAQYR